jgi:hypothetical protein
MEGLLFGALGFLSTSGLAVAGERGGEQGGGGPQFTAIPLFIKVAIPCPANQPLPLRRTPIRQDPTEAPSLVRRAWVSVFQDPTVTSLGRDNTHSNWPRVCFDLASIPSMLDRRHAASHWPSLCTTSSQLVSPAPHRRANPS